MAPIGKKRSKRIKRQLQDDADRWILSYADFITLLFAFFVMMYAISSINVTKYKTMAESVGSAFNGQHKRQLKSKFITHSNIMKNHTDQDSMVEKKLTVEDEKKFHALNAKLKTLDGDFFKVRGYDGWIEIEIQSKHLFDSGKATIKPEAEQHLQGLAIPLSQMDGPIVVEGYTDNVIIRTLQFPSNWALSAARAADVVNILNKAGLESTRLAAVGFGSQYPVANNTTEEGREKNRRVVIVILKDNQSKRRLDPMKSNLIVDDTSVENVNIIKVKSMKEIRTESGGLKFIQSIDERHVKPKIDYSKE